MALKMLDASAKFPPAGEMSHKMIHHPGRFDACLEVATPAWRGEGGGGHPRPALPAHLPGLGPRPALTERGQEGGGAFECHQHPLPPTQSPGNQGARGIFPAQES